MDLLLVSTRLKKSWLVRLEMDPRFVERKRR
jgi:hypothetical protein